MELVGAGDRVVFRGTKDEGLVVRATSEHVYQVNWDDGMVTVEAEEDLVVLPT